MKRVVRFSRFAELLGLGFRQLDQCLCGFAGGDVFRECAQLLIPHFLSDFFGNKLQSPRTYVAH